MIKEILQPLQFILYVNNHILDIIDFRKKDTKSWNYFQYSNPFFFQETIIGW